jgi:glycine/D-amino acid oxidase-like deaminating enzyme
MRLHSGAPFWLVNDGLHDPITAETPPALPRHCDVVVIGAGITGALVADALSAEHLAVAILDRRAPACGSTAASTALVSYEIDLSLQDLSDRMGSQGAVRAYRASAGAVDRLAEIAGSLPEPCGFARRASLWLARRKSDGPKLEREVQLRQDHGLDAEFRSAGRVESEHGFPSQGALYTRQAAVVDPVRLTRALLHRAQGRGATVHPWTPARDVSPQGEGMEVITDRGSIRARWVVYAMGYEMPQRLQGDLTQLHSTFALVTEPVPDLGRWKDQAIVWETGWPYFYMRLTEDCRVMIGGADSRFENPAVRDRLMPGRLKKLERQLGRWLPGVDLQTAFLWAGTFGDTKDGLPYIGPLPDCPGAFAALGYGANGITFSAVAAGIIADLCMGRSNPDAGLFRLDR